MWLAERFKFIRNDSEFKHRFTIKYMHLDINSKELKTNLIQLKIRNKCKWSVFGWILVILSEMKPE